MSHICHKPFSHNSKCLSSPAKPGEVDLRDSYAKLCMAYDETQVLNLKGYERDTSTIKAGLDMF